MTDTEFDLDDEPVLTAEGEVAAAICGHQVVMQRGDARGGEADIGVRPALSGAPAFSLLTMATSN